jgi:hypothetical protein
MTDFNSRDDKFDEKQKSLIIKWRNERSKHAKKQLPLLIIFGLLFSGGAIYLWRVQYNMSLESSLGVVAGIILASFSFHVINQNRVQSYQKLFSEDFTGEDLKEYLEEESKVNLRFLKQYRKYGWIINVLFIVIVVLLSLPKTVAFASMMLFTALPVFFFGIVVLGFLNIRFLKR